jgi:chemotaxis protein histidine kinase CheA
MTEAIETKQIEQEVAPVVRRAGEIVVRNHEERAAAVAFLREVKGAAAKVKEFFGPMKTAAHEAHKRITAAETAMLAPLAEAERGLKVTVGTYDAEVERAAEIERRRLQAIADEKARKERERAEQEASRQRQIEEAARAEAARLRQEAAQADAAERDRLEREADARDRAAAAAAVKVENKELAAAFAVAPVIQVAAPAKQAGESRRTTWKAQLTSLPELTGLPIGDVRLSFLTFDQAAANRFAIATKGTVTVPGVAFVSETSLAIGGIR